ncbi:monothiol glutaredoxin-4 isoform X2 [Folsomia candida]|uniref:monothiol glutaredoxin-4 isoform X2 n=1 Tax=Folsomia candida TaxID=158441 RepID=UPI001604CE60|nr:monothiol glutaredoxin-4 isoform X2 [Folsomia candida]
MPVIHVRSESEYETVLTKAADKLVIVDFTAKWCGPCQKIAPIYEELSNKYRNSIFLKVDVDDTQEIAMANNVSAMPTFIFLRQKKELDRVRGADPDALEQRIKKLGGPAGQPSFTGEGRRLGAEDNNLSVEANSSTSGSSVSVESAQRAMGVDESKPVTKINVRMADGSKSTVTLNLSQPVSSIREFICAIRPDQASKSFVIMTTFPSKVYENEEISIEEAKLMNAVVVQKMKKDYAPDSGYMESALTF